MSEAGTPSIFLRAGSHRGYKKIKALGIELRWYYDARLLKGGKFLLVSREELERIRAADIAGWSRCRNQSRDAYGKCWS